MGRSCGTVPNVQSAGKRCRVQKTWPATAAPRRRRSRPPGQASLAHRRPSGSRATVTVGHHRPSTRSDVPPSGHVPTRTGRGVPPSRHVPTRTGRDVPPRRPHPTRTGRDVPPRRPPCRPTTRGQARAARMRAPSQPRLRHGLNDGVHWNIAARPGHKPPSQWAIAARVRAAMFHHHAMSPRARATMFHQAAHTPRAQAAMLTHPTPSAYRPAPTRSSRAASSRTIHPPNCTLRSRSGGSDDVTPLDAARPPRPGTDAGSDQSSPK